MAEMEVVWCFFLKVMSVLSPVWIHGEAADFHKRSDELIFVGDLIGKGTGMGSGFRIFFGFQWSMTGFRWILGCYNDVNLDGFDGTGIYEVLLSFISFTSSH